jgi:hypothetical protein
MVPLRDSEIMEAPHGHAVDSVPAPEPRFPLPQGEGKGEGEGDARKPSGPATPKVGYGFEPFIVSSLWLCRPWLTRSMAFRC